ncbi:MAG: hypothetical protein IJB45_00060 [Clostridia bacterium]|nr:hypothetical protein [Clostridia bacterium]
MNSKALKIVAAVLAVVMVASVAVFFVSKGNGGTPLSKEPEPVAYSYEQSAYTMSPSSSLKGENGEIFMPTDFENIYYTASLDGKIAFYEYNAGSFAASTLPVKTVKASLSATYEKIPVTVSYIEKDGRVCGYGVFTSDMSADVDVYSFAFVKLINKPAGYGTGHLLLADFDKNEFYKNDKIYSEIYNFNLSNGSASTYVSNNTRLIDINGAFRNDWTMLTDDFIKNLGNAKYFISSRYYTGDERGERADIMVLSDAYRPKIEVEDILGLWFVNDANGMHYLRKTANGFANVVNAGGKETVLSEFEGDYFADYLQSGKWLINKKSLVFTDLLTGATKTLKDINISSADSFAVSPDGNKLVFAANGEANASGTMIQQLTYCTADGSKAPETYAEPLLFAESCDFAWLDNNGVISVRPLSGDGSKAGSYIYSY